MGMNGGVQPPPAPLGLIWPGADYDSPGHLATIIMQQINLDSGHSNGAGERQKYVSANKGETPTTHNQVGG